MKESCTILPRIVLLIALSVAAIADAATDDIIIIEDFGSNSMTWYAKNDPIMGGKSNSVVTVENGLGKLKGEVVDVPSLQAPGFVLMEAKSNNFPDVSTCEGIEIEARSNTDYAGYRISFGENQAPSMRYGRGYKAPFNVVKNTETVRISFSEFSDYWNEGTGVIRVPCSTENPQYCPDMNTLRSLVEMGIWGEGVNGPVDLEVLSIKAYDCASTNDGDFFKSMVSMFSSGTPDDEQKDSNGSSIGGKVAVSLAAVSLFISLVAIFVVFLANRKRGGAEPEPVLEAASGDQVL
jgi:hypothetical protein